MSKIDDLYESYNTRNDTYTARIRAANQLIEHEDKIIALLKSEGNDSAKKISIFTLVTKAIRDDINAYTIEFCPSSYDTTTFSNLLLEYIISYYKTRCNCTNIFSSDLDMSRTLIALYEYIKENR